MALTDFINVLQRYAGASASNPPASVQQDFSAVATSASQDHLAGGLAEAFHSNQTPAFPQMIGQLFNQSNGQQKAGILNQLLASAGPNVGSLLGGGLSSMLGGGTSLTPEQAQQIPAESVQKLAEHSQQNDPSVVERASGFYAQHPQVVQALGAGALAMIMSHLSSRQS